MCYWEAFIFLKEAEEGLCDFSNHTAHVTMCVCKVMTWNVTFSGRSFSQPHAPLPLGTPYFPFLIYFSLQHFITFYDGVLFTCLFIVYLPWVAPMLHEGSPFCSLLCPQFWELCLAPCEPSINICWINEWINDGWTWEMRKYWGQTKTLQASFFGSAATAWEPCLSVPGLWTLQTRLGKCHPQGFHSLCCLSLQNMPCGFS